MQDAAVEAVFARNSLLGRAAETDEISSVALFLASDASSYMAGTQILGRWWRVPHRSLMIRGGRHDGAYRHCAIRLFPQGVLPTLYRACHCNEGSSDQGRVACTAKQEPLTARSLGLCVSAWNKDPVFGVIGIQSGL
ncbi:SDR family oxidoreductase [Bradyrhizobium barranii]|uniref:SDR family oxidoreductase n=1 Tax=Bradyrhizobium TaxID=374 RepID=UPI003F27D3D0